MQPPSAVSLPFKLIFCVLVDGCRLVAGSPVQSFPRRIEAAASKASAGPTGQKPSPLSLGDVPWTVGHRRPSGWQLMAAVEPFRNAEDARQPRSLCVKNLATSLAVDAYPRARLRGL
jgi:hypothetical protein